MTLSLSEDALLYFRDTKAYLIDIRGHQEYEFSSRQYWDAFGDVLFNNGSIDQEVLAQLISLGMIKKNQKVPEKIFLNRLAYLFHTATKDGMETASDLADYQFAEKFFQTSKEILEKPIPPKRSVNDFSKVIKLEPAQFDELKDVSLYQTLAKRRTIREFLPEQITIQQLTRILYMTFGYFHGEEENALPFKRRTSPSGGCLQAIEPYVLAFNVQGLEPGIYFYDGENHGLGFVDEICCYETLATGVSGQFFAKNCSAAIFLTADLERFWWKYKMARHYQVIFVEAGHFAQTMQLWIAAEGLNNWITDVFMETNIEKLLRLDPLKQAVGFFIAIGKGAHQSDRQVMKRAINRHEGSKPS